MKQFVIFALIFFAAIVAACDGAPGETKPIGNAPVTVTNVTPIAKYDATLTIRAFATTNLGASVTVTRAGGASGDVNLPASQKTKIDAAFKGAGQTVAGLIALRDLPGVAVVALGSGKISGDVNTDVTSASLGAFSIVTKIAPPTDAANALALIREYFPALAVVNLQPQQSVAKDAFTFYATTTRSSADPKTKQVTKTAQAIIAGTTREGNGTIVWVVIGNGTFAASVKP
ncbi:MAG: hypothetical protein HZC40_07995 [Chloroflexi bacterium]|nr:hypothetical protein [Chloroflexota bacterium]